MRKVSPLKVNSKRRLTSHPKRERRETARADYGEQRKQLLDPPFNLEPTFGDTVFHCMLGPTCHCPMPILFLLQGGLLDPVAPPDAAADLQTGQEAERMSDQTGGGV